MFRLRFITIFAISGLLFSCKPEMANSTVPSTPEEPETPEIIVFPENPLSTLDSDVEICFTGDNSLSYADCFGNYYHTNSYMWGIYFQQYTTKEQIYIEIMHPEHIYEIPLGSYGASESINDTNILLKGCIDADGYQAYSWYTRLKSDEHSGAVAPIYGGSITIEDMGDELYKATFDLIDDKGNKITGTYEGRMILEDFRIN